MGNKPPGVGRLCCTRRIAESSVAELVVGNIADNTVGSTVATNTKRKEQTFNGRYSMKMPTNKHHLH